MKRYAMTLHIESEGATIAHITVSDKTYDTLQQLIRLALADLEKVEPLKGKRRLFHKPERVDPPIEIPDGPSSKEFEDA